MKWIHESNDRTTASFLAKACYTNYNNPCSNYMFCLIKNICGRVGRA
ncbi:MAG: hypothetical protein RR561_00630 [Peptostreptococcus sp.]